MTKQYNLGSFKTEVEFVSIDKIDCSRWDLTVFDENTDPLVAKGTEKRWVIPSGEANKKWETVDSILKTALDNGLTRDSVIAGIGGGVLTDLTAFAASIYLRGCSLVLVPTTLLAMVDASFGGKTGMDYQGFKNMVGTFYPASKLIVSVDFLKTLPEEELKSGLAEVIKTALLGDLELLSILETNKEAILDRDPAVLQDVVERCIAVKGQVVEEDLKESGRRAHLNLGHTFGHALESIAGLGEFSHGEAVAWGMRQAAQVGESLGVNGLEYTKKVNELLDLYEFTKPVPETDPMVFIKAMHKDKKKKGGQLRFILQKAPLETIIQPLSDEELLEHWRLES